jgi:hypothetical protein
MTASDMNLNDWLQQATRGLAKDSAAQVRIEIREHYESAVMIAINHGATAEEAHRSALTALGEAKDANCQYRKVLLTSAEAKMLREGNWEAHAICFHPWLKGLLLALPVLALAIAAASFLTGASTLAWTLLAGGTAMGLILTAPFLLPIYTPSRGRAFRYAKWLIILAVFGLVFWPDVLKSSWLLCSCLWPMVWIERTRTSIRRKLPIAQWPKHLYL